jgi:aminomethyltransferase
VSRLDENRYRWTAADPSLRWFTQNAVGLDVQIEDISERVAALALQGPTSAGVLRAAAEADIETLKYFRVTRGSIAGVPVEISRTGYTGDLGYEIWVEWSDALKVWDALMRAGRAFEIRPAGMLALDVARVEAGLLLIEVDFFSCRKAMIPSQMYSPFEMSLDRLVSLDKASFVGQAALAAEHARGPARRIAGLELDWSQVESIYEKVGLPPAVSAIASRVAVPVLSRGKQVGKATSTTWSPVLKKMIALATIDAAHVAEGSSVDIEVTVEAVRHHVGAKVVKTPFYNPPQKTKTPPIGN